jgi:hypothetical protein
VTLALRIRRHGRAIGNASGGSDVVDENLIWGQTGSTGNNLDLFAEVNESMESTVRTCDGTTFGLRDMEDMEDVGMAARSSRISFNDALRSGSSLSIFATMDATLWS